MTDHLDDDDDVVAPRSAEAWAMDVALMVEREHGDRGHVHIAAMVGKFALEGKQDYVDTWKAIARAYDLLMRPPGGVN